MGRNRKRKPKEAPARPPVPRPACADEAIASLQEAFRDMPPPDRDTIAGPIPEEREWVEHQFAGKRWDEVVFTEGETYDTLSVLLSETAFPYYFVSLLYQTLLQSGECLAVYEVQSALGFDEGWQKRFYASIAALEQDQILALAQAVRCIADLTPGPIGYGSPEDHEGLVKMSKRIREMAEKP